MALRAVRDDLLDQLGDASPSQRLLIEHVAKTTILARVVSGWCFAQPTLVGEDGNPLAALAAYTTLVESSRRLLTTLGLKRVEAEPPNLAAFLAERQRERAKQSRSD